MKHILLFGAGKSATVLIAFLLHEVAKEGWRLTVADANAGLIEAKLKNAPHTFAACFDIENAALRKRYINDADLVISLLPPALHILIARDCVAAKKNLLTASYVDGDLKKLQPEIEQNNLLFLCEMGLDPGIDHMSAKRLIDDIQELGGTIISFLSHCGGLVAPESDDNPWRYKISWNPRAIVLAGKAGAVYKWNGVEKHISYAELFSEKRFTDIDSIGRLCWYPNRDSLSYMNTYNLLGCNTFIRTTLRHPDFISGWKNIIDLHLTDETPRYNAAGKSFKALLQEHLDKQHAGIKPNAVAAVTDQAGIAFAQLQFLVSGNDKTLMDKAVCSAADILQYALEKKLALGENDKDMVVMKHEIEYKHNDEFRRHKSTLIVKGENNQQTAMAKTVGLPLGIAAKLILKGVVNCSGLRIPDTKDIYEPVLAELAQHGIQFLEKTEAII